MNFLEPIATPILVAALLLLLTWAGWRLHQRSPARRVGPMQEALDTVQAWPPESARVMTIHERQAYELLRRALPGFMVLAQVPLSRFLRVPTRHSYAEWMHRVGQLSADLLVCDSGSRVLAVVDVRPINESERGRRRHERLARVLRAATINVQVWREGDMPTLADVRRAFAAELAPPAPVRKPTPSRPLPLIPTADIREVIAAGDDAYADDNAHEPVPSTFFDDLDPIVTVQASRA